MSGRDESGILTECRPRLPEGSDGGNGTCLHLPEGMSGRENLRLRLLCGQECLEAEGLWREVFTEDTLRFTDYYFEKKAAKNRGLVLEGEQGIRAMLYLTPERMMAGGREVTFVYLVGVATKKEYRHRGYMAALLKASFGLLYGERMPFVFLMPASPDIYTPFSFTWIYDRPVWEDESLKKERLVRLEMQDVGRMAEFAQDFLQKEKSVYIVRDAAYYRQQMEELAAQEGCALGYEDRAGRLKGLCMYTEEEGVPEVLEVLADRETESSFVSRRKERSPSIMGRIVCAERMLSLIRGRRRVCFSLALSDPLIPENNGVFLCRVGEEGTRVERLNAASGEPAGGAGDVTGEPEGHAGGKENVRLDCAGGVADVRMDIAELTAALFGYGGTPDGIFREIRPFSPVWINEIV